MKKTITPILATALLSRQSRRSDSCKGVSDFFGWPFLPSSAMAGGVSTVSTSPAGRVSSTISMGEAEEPGDIIPEDRSVFLSFVSIVSCLLLGLNARVGQRIEDVRQHIAYNDAYCQQHYGCLNHRVVAVVNRLDGLVADARNVEDVLDEERPGYQQTKQQANDGQ